MTVCIVDTSVFCNVLAVPGRSQQVERALEELEEYVDSEFALLLPLATIYETGNHIAQANDGDQRRQVAERFSEQVRRACEGEAYWSPTPIHDSEALLDWLDDFPDEAMRQVSLADLSIIRIFEEQRRLHHERRVFIWAYDGDLRSYDTQN